MSHSIRRAALLAAVGLPAILGAQTASAALITDWTFDVDSAFTDFAEDVGSAGGTVTGSGENAVLKNDGFDPNYTTLEWGQDGTSSVLITSNVNGSIDTNGAAEQGAIFTHNNSSINANSTMLDTFKITSQLTLVGTAEAPPGGSLTGDDQIVGPITFNSFFTETFNGGTCAVEDAETVCDDIFVLSNASGLATLGDGQSFIVDDYEYTVTLGLQGLGPLTEDECEAADADTGCFGLTTAEGVSNGFNTTFQITAAQIPAPGILALFGIGLMGLGFAAKRQSNKA
jgi:hypothetical protein